MRPQFVSRQPGAGLRPGTSRIIAGLRDGTCVTSRTAIVATGVSYCRPTVPRAGGAPWSRRVPGRRQHRSAREVTLAVRGTRLADSRSDYLIR